MMGANHDTHVILNKCVFNDYRYLGHDIFVIVSTFGDSADIARVLPVYSVYLRYHASFRGHELV